MNLAADTKNAMASGCLVDECLLNLVKSSEGES